MIADLPLLSLVIWLPILGGLIVLVNGDDNIWVRPLSLLMSLLTLVVSLALYAGFDLSTHEMQFVEQAVWISSYDINYH